jgi:hypothetical protein
MQFVPQQDRGTLPPVCYSDPLKRMEIFHTLRNRGQRPRYVHVQRRKTSPPRAAPPVRRQALPLPRRRAPPPPLLRCRAPPRSDAAPPRPRPCVGVPKLPHRRPTSTASSRRHLPRPPRPPLRLASRLPQPPRSPLPRLKEEKRRKKLREEKKRKKEEKKRRKEKEKERERKKKKYLFVENMISKLYCLLLFGKENKK